MRPLLKCILGSEKTQKMSMNDTYLLLVGVSVWASYE